MLSCLLVLLATVPAAEPVDYKRDVKPIFTSRCASCHGALQQKAGLRLDASPLIRKGAKSGAVLTPGRPDESPLLDAVLGRDRPRMPPEKEGPALTGKQLAVLKNWIEQGAKMPDEPIPEDPRKHWAFVKPRRNGTGIDELLRAKQQTAGVTQRPEAGKEALLRRVTFDLTGLPPTEAELVAFRADNSPDAYEKVVDRLLGSPLHGERWARHWMDVWRYSDWYGRRAVPDVWNSAPQIYRWRDWIVHSLNADRGYDRMMKEMLAGDEIAPEDDGARDATGFLVRNWYALNPNQWMRDIVEHTGKAFLGLTLNCAHCHDHKYDPITQEEYFRFRAFFEPLGLRQDRVPGEVNPGPFQKYDYSKLRVVVKTGAVRVFDENPDAKTILYELGDERSIMKGKPAATPAAPAFLGGDRLTIEPVSLPTSVWYPGFRTDFRAEDTSLATGAKLAALRARMAADDVKFGGAKGDLATLSRAASKAEREANLRTAEAQLSAVKGKTKEEAAALKAVEAARKVLATDSVVYTSLSPVYPKTSTGRRKALALWIASKDNPLTARVAVNHVWKHYFNRPIVETVADLGRNGARPSHPELLDWLAVELMESDWSLKRIHRLIVTSSAYRAESSAGGAKEMARDPDNRLLWRFPPRRLEAEAVRDAVLFVSGDLELKRGGPSLDNVSDAWSHRRSLYFTVYPEDGGHHRFLELFDPPDPCDSYKRSSTVVPQQALALTNSRLLLDHSRLLARKFPAAMAQEEFIRAIFTRLLTRAPSEQEKRMCQDFLKRQEELFRAARVPVASGDASIAPSTDPHMRARESLVRVLFSHDEFVTVR